MSDDPNLVPVIDLEYIQSVLISAALAGDSLCLHRLPALLPAFQEPYRTALAELLRRRQQGGFVDRNVLGALLQGRPLVRPDPYGHPQQLAAGQVVSLIGTESCQPGQAKAYLDLLADNLRERREREFAASAADVAQRCSSRPEELLAEVQQLVAEHRGRVRPGPQKHPSELLELLPYMQDLESRQRGEEFLGLDSGFQHVNNLCNGLDTGLFIVAARPGEGKTTWAWQVACQVAEKEQVPVLFFSFEQSKGELRAKVLSRLSSVQYRHILRGRLRTDDENWPKVLEAAARYARFGRHITIVEGDETMTLDVIRNLTLQTKAAANADRCLLVVDYLQIIPLQSKNAPPVSSTKEKVDTQVSALRRLARELESPIMAISSENRAGYTKPRSMDVFKESGIIEYSADIAAVMVRDPQGAEPNDEYRIEALNIIKNRNGQCGSVKFKFYGKRAEFVETEKGALPVED
jgi:replicative DNA helicase